LIDCLSLLRVAKRAVLPVVGLRVFLPRCVGFTLFVHVTGTQAIKIDRRGKPRRVSIHDTTTGPFLTNVNIMFLNVLTDGI